MVVKQRKSAVWAIIPNSKDFKHMFESLIHGEPEFQDFNCLDDADRARLTWLYEYGTPINNDHIDGELLVAAHRLVENLIEISNGGYVSIPDSEDLAWAHKTQDDVFDLFEFHPDSLLQAYQLRRHMFDPGHKHGVRLPEDLQLEDYTHAKFVRVSPEYVKQYREGRLNAQVLR